MEDRLKALMHDLGNAINDSLSDSDRIAEAIGEIKQAGFDVFLVLGSYYRIQQAGEADRGAGRTAQAHIGWEDPFYFTGSAVPESSEDRCRGREVSSC